MNYIWTTQTWYNEYAGIGLVDSTLDFTQTLILTVVFKNLISVVDAIQSKVVKVIFAIAVIQQ